MTGGDSNDHRELILRPDAPLDAAGRRPLRIVSEMVEQTLALDPPFNSNRKYEAFWGETKERRSFEDRHESTKAYIDHTRPRCVELHRGRKNLFVLFLSSRRA